MKTKAIITTIALAGSGLAGMLFAQDNPAADNPNLPRQVQPAKPRVNGQAAQTPGSILNDPAGADIGAQELGTITITGTVGSAEEKRNIEEQVQAIAGVKKVKNMLRVKGEAGQDINDPAGAEKKQDGLFNQKKDRLQKETDGLNLEKKKPATDVPPNP